jgi:hypothetical protein
MFLLVVAVFERAATAGGVARRGLLLPLFPALSDIGVWCSG